MVPIHFKEDSLLIQIDSNANLIGNTFTDTQEKMVNLGISRPTGQPLTAKKYSVPDVNSHEVP